MKFNVDELLTALEQPVVVLGGVEHTLRYPSFRERLKVQKMYDDQDWTEDNGQEEVIRYMASIVGLEEDDLLELPELVLGEVMSFLLLMVRGADLTPLSTESNEN